MAELLSRGRLGLPAVDGPLDLRVDVLGEPLERQALLDALDGALDGRLDAVDAPLDGRHEVADVALPARGPADRLRRDALLGAGQHHVEGRQGAHTGCAEAEDLTGPGVGDADGHGGALAVASLVVWCGWALPVDQVAGSRRMSFVG